MLLRSFVCLFVCMWALSLPQSSTNHHQAPPTNWKWSADEVIQFRTQKVKGQGQGHQNVEKHIFHHNSANTYRRETILDVLESVKRILSDGHIVT